MHPLDAIFHPKSIVVIGASEKPDSMGGLVIQNLLEGGYKGDLAAVNLQNYESVFSVPSYKKISKVKFSDASASETHIDLAVICIPQKNIPSVLKEIGEQGIKAALILTGGIARRLSEGKAVGERLSRIALKYGIRLLGPNCLGVIVPDAKLNLSFSHINAKKGKVAFIGQSASLGSALLDWATGRDIGFSHFVTVGERADIKASDIIDYLCADYRVQSLLLHVERIHNARRFMTVLRGASKNKTVLAIKSTADEAVPKGLTNRDKLDSIFFDRAGVMLVDSIDKMFSGLETLSRRKPVYGDKLAIVCNGLGPAILAEQELKRLGGQLADLSNFKPTEDMGLWYQDETGGNPLVLSPNMDVDEVKHVFKELDKDPNIGAILFIHSPNQRSKSDKLAREIAPILRRCYHTIFSCWMGDATVENARTLFDQNALLNYDSPNDAVEAFMTMVHHNQNQSQLRQTPTSSGLSSSVSDSKNYGFEKDKVRHLLTQAKRDERDYLTWLEAREVLKSYGMDLIDTHFESSFDNLFDTINPDWFPVALRLIHRKGCEPFSYQGDFKQRWKAVVINQQNKTQLEENRLRLQSELQQRFPDSELFGFSVQPMLRRLDSVQFSMGITRDDVYGPIVFFGEGGKPTDILADRQYTLPPLNTAFSTQLIEDSHAWQVLRESSQHLEFDRQMLLHSLMTLSQMLNDQPMIEALDINLLLESGKRLVVLNVACSIGEEVLPVISAYPAHLSERLMLKNNKEVLVRPIKGEDEPLLKDFFTRMPAEDVRFRFFGSRVDFAHRELAEMCQIDYEREMAFIAIDQGRMLGELRMSLDVNHNEIEFSIMVDASTKGTGLASRLMSRLINHAKQRGVSAITAEVMEGNRAMRGLGRKYEFEQVHSEDGVVGLRLEVLSLA